MAPIRFPARARAIIAALAAMTAAPSPAAAQDAADFYRDKALTLTVGFNPGGAYDVYARLFARFFPRYLREGQGGGAPAMAVKNMPGAGSVIAANYLYTRAPADGTEFGLIAGDAALTPLFGGVATQFDAQKFTWLGSANREAGACFAWTGRGVNAASDLFERGMVTGAAGTSSLLVPTMLNAVLGARLKLVRGYAGTSALMLAVERGEVEGMCGMVLAAVQTEHPDWLAKGLIKPVLQIGLEPNPALAGIPLVTDFAREPGDTQLLRLLIGWTIMGRPFLAPPGVPPARAQALRAAFARMAADTEFRAAADAARIGVDTIGAADIEAYLRDSYATPAPVIAKAKAILGASQ